MEKLQKQTIKIRCPESGKLHLLLRVDFKGKDQAVLDCPDCGRRHTAPLDEASTK
jgi:uncharacterized Zn finger protein